MCIVMAATMAACGAGMSEVRGPTGGLKLRCQPALASVYLDEEYRGSCQLFGARALLISPGTHRLQVEATGYYPYYAELATGRTVQTVEVGLVQRPD